MRIAVHLVGMALTAELFAAPHPSAQRSSQSESIRPAAAAIIEAFTRYELVAIGEAHRHQQVHDFIVALLNDSAFLPEGGDVVVEFGNARYQSAIDRYVSGEPVSRADLVRVWRDAVNILVWDAPVYERVFETVRQINQRRSPRNHLRVLLADPPIDWSAIQDRVAWERIAASRDRFAADVVERDVLLRKRRGLLIFGSGHVENEGAFDHGKPNRARQPNLAELLQSEHMGQTLFILADPMTITFGNRTNRWRPPLLVKLKGTFAGQLHVGPSDDTPRLEELADEFLYLGPAPSMTISRPNDAIYQDAAYMRELLRRDKIQGGANTLELRRLALGR